MTKSSYFSPSGYQPIILLIKKLLIKKLSALTNIGIENEVNKK
jgi:hypothetical protein